MSFRLQQAPLYYFVDVKKPYISKTSISEKKNFENQHFQIPMRSWRCPQLAFCAKYSRHLNKVIYLIFILR